VELKFEKEIGRLLGSTWLSVDSRSYFEKVKSLIENLDELSRIENKKFALLLFYDIFQEAPNKLNIKNSISGLLEVFKQEQLKLEVLVYLEIRINTCKCIEKNSFVDFHFPLKLHGRFLRNQILVALGLSKEESKSSNREGVAVNTSINMEVLFVTLDKSEGRYSPSTMYEDYALSEKIFHWQSQNKTKPNSNQGLGYINQSKNKKRILLFVREKNEDENKLTMGYLFLGSIKYLSHEGSCPMSIKWELKEPIPPGILNESRKLAVG
jgi:hypothetical protein